MMPLSENKAISGKKPHFQKKSWVEFMFYTIKSGIIVLKMAYFS